MKKEKWVWMPHAGHFVCGHRCQFKLNTYVGKYIVSTVGEMVYDQNKGFEEIGCDRLYETMVFKAVESGNKCCPYEIKVSDEVDFEGYNTPEEAYKGHLYLCDKWSK